MNLTEKIIYAHIRNRFDFFKGLGKEYYDTPSKLSLMCAIWILKQQEMYSGNSLRTT